MVLYLLYGVKTVKVYTVRCTGTLLRYVREVSYWLCTYCTKCTVVVYRVPAEICQRGLLLVNGYVVCTYIYCTKCTVAVYWFRAQIYRPLFLVMYTYCTVQYCRKYTVCLCTGSLLRRGRDKKRNLVSTIKKRFSGMVLGIEEGWKQKARQRSLRRFGGQNLFNWIDSEETLEFNRFFQIDRDSLDPMVFNYTLTKKYFCKLKNFLIIKWNLFNVRVFVIGNQWFSL